MNRLTLITILATLIGLSSPCAADAADSARASGERQDVKSVPPDTSVRTPRSPGGTGVTHEYHRAGQAAPGDAADKHRGAMGNVQSNPLYDDKPAPKQNPLHDPKGRATTKEYPTAQPQTQEKPRH